MIIDLFLKSDRILLVNTKNENKTFGYRQDR